MITFIIATRNAHKVQEIRALLSDDFAYRTLNDIPDAPHVVEDAGSFAGNAMKKSVQLAQWLARHPEQLARILPAGQPSTVFCLADDSGLEVDALQGAPGVHSARFAGLDNGGTGNSSDAANNQKLLSLLADVPRERRTARFRCVLSLTPVLGSDREPRSRVCAADEAELRTELFEGACEGSIDHGPRGTHGFGYDPLFVPAGLSQSFAELGEEVKNRISHRAHALQKLQQWLRSNRFPDTNCTN